MTTRSKHTAFEKISMHANEKKEKDWSNILVGVIMVVYFAGLVAFALKYDFRLDEWIIGLN